jgi:glycosyltransferase involved in cell wall biosynthesis
VGCDVVIGAVHQFVSSLVPHDAVSTHALHARDVIRGMGLESEIFVKEAWGGLEAEARPYREFGDSRAGGGGTWLLYQAATGSPVGEFVAERPEPKIVDYHNVTPPEVWRPWEVHVMVELMDGLRQVEALAPLARLGIGDSAFNAADLEGLGYGATAVAPVMFDAEGTAADEATAARLHDRKQGGGADFLFVGRLAPNKAQHDLVKALAAYRRLYDDRARLHLVGTSSSWAYLRALRAFVEELGLEDAVSMPGSVDDAAKAAYYELADAFVSLSEHEGFGIPLVEAMRRGTPVVALRAAAVPETLGGAGILLDGKDPAVVAAALHRAVTDGPLRAALVEAGRRRADDFALPRTKERFASVMAEALG